MIYSHRNPARIHIHDYLASSFQQTFSESLEPLNRHWPSGWNATALVKEMQIQGYYNKMLL
jgi:hypothetical protein